MVRISCLLATLAGLAGLVLAHPGEAHSDLAAARELLKREAQASVARRALGACEDGARSRELAQRSHARRAAAAADLRQKRSLTTTPPYLRARAKADLVRWAGVGHNSSLTGVSVDTDLFGANTSAILAPETTEGPYFVAGEYVREIIAERQAGVPIYMEYQFIDVNTCEPVPGVYVDVWHANATGVYSGVAARGNGAGLADPSNVNTTFLRGVQKTDADGVANFQSIFPGHYGGRATHVHLVAHTGGAALANSTFSGGGTVSHVGQTFYPDDLIAAVEATAPYSSNAQKLTTNERDMIAAGQATADYDPFPQYVLLGDSVADGIISWIQIGIDASASYEIHSAATLTEAGGVPNANPISIDTAKLCSALCTSACSGLDDLMEGVMAKTNPILVGLDKLCSSLCSGVCTGLAGIIGYGADIIGYGADFIGIGAPAPRD